MNSTDRRRHHTWGRLDADPRKGRFGYQVRHEGYIQGAKNGPTVSRPKLLWALEVIRCWWADRLPLPPEPTTKVKGGWL